MFKLIQTDQEPGASGANQESAEVPSNFTPIGKAADAVILRLQSKLPRIKVKRLRGLRGEENTEPSR
ncbi:hypothetical protein CDO22_08550 [Sinorhizobium meliloti]|nr:hypothetical protein CDO22_08550 [Sinorhizobium meliloti]